MRSIIAFVILSIMPLLPAAGLAQNRLNEALRAAGIESDAYTVTYFYILMGRATSRCSDLRINRVAFEELRNWAKLRPDFWSTSGSNRENALRAITEASKELDEKAGSGICEGMFAQFGKSSGDRPPLLYRTEASKGN